MKITWLAEPTVATESGTRRLPVRFHYDPSYDPYAVAMVILGETGVTVTWLVARELLRDGLSRMVGEGDVRATPGGMSVGVHLSSPDGQALLVFARADVSQFLASTYIEVPDGREDEHIDWARFPGVPA